MTERAETTRIIQIAAGRVLNTTAVFETYWQFAAKRQEMFLRRVAGAPAPWTDDPTLAAHRFTNAYRAADRVSQYLIRHVLYEGPQAIDEIFFRALLFKIFKRIDTWEQFVAAVGTPTWAMFAHERYARVLDSMLGQGRRIYSAAYIMPSPAFGNARKHRDLLRRNNPRAWKSSIPIERSKALPRFIECDGLQSTV